MGTSNLKKALSDWFDELRQPILLEQSPEATLHTQNGERDKTFDILKGIAIICMIVGHCQTIFFSFIYTFHMPLFFFVSGFFLKERSLKEELLLSFKRLIVPYIFIAICMCVMAVFRELSNISWADGTYTQKTIFSFMLGYQGGFTSNRVGTIGIPWFILAMFWARFFVVYFTNHFKSQAVLSLIFFFLGIAGIICEKTFFIPFCIPQGLAAAGFIYVGLMVKKWDLLKQTNIKKMFPFLILLWLLSWEYGGVSMFRNFFPCGYVFGLFGALGFFLTLYCIVKNLYNSNSIMWKLCYWGGRYSLILLTVHSIEQHLCNWPAFAVLHHVPYKFVGIFEIAMSISIAFSFSFVILKIKYLRKGVFQIDKI